MARHIKNESKRELCYILLRSRFLQVQLGQSGRLYVQLWLALGAQVAMDLQQVCFHRWLWAGGPVQPEGASGIDRFGSGINVGSAAGLKHAG